MPFSSKKMHRYLTFKLILIICFSLSSPAKSQITSPLKFDFGSGETEEGYIGVNSTTTYNKNRGYGIISNSTVSDVHYKTANGLHNDFITSDKPFYFAVEVPEGNYRITVQLGDVKGKSVTTVRAESRRLMLKEVNTAAGEIASHTFIVNVRKPQINSTEEIARKSRELTYLNWDNLLSLEFNNKRPCLVSVEIEKAEDVPTIYLAGNSTVVDQEYEPWAAWGQMITAFFKPEVAVANYAESGESLKSFIGEKRLKKIMSVIKPGDYLFIEFAHNDQKPGGAHVAPFTGYKDHLKIFIKAAREKGAIPVLVTSMHRRNFNENGEIINTLDDYPEAMRQVGKEENITVIDLNRMSKTLYEAMGPEESKKAFVHYPAGTFPGQDKELKDNTHFSTYGAYQLAKCIVEGIKNNNLGLEEYLKEDLEAFNPAMPDPEERWDLPLAPATNLLKPSGN